jgi:hypothetical protein
MTDNEFDEIMKAAVEESLNFLVSVVRDETMCIGDRLKAAAILLRSAPFVELGCLEFDLGYLNRSAGSN